jgi:hypothetical protein
MIKHETATMPSLAQLFKATGTALLVASTILVAIVLPAEYGIDVTGLGKTIGLTKLAAPKPDTASALRVAAPDAPQATLSKSERVLRSDEVTLTLAPGENTEVKALMQKGSQFVFSWSATGGVVKSDMHGEPINAKPDEFSTYWKEKRQQSGQGAFTAPFEGTHGWYWHNRSEQAVTITVKLSGFYEKVMRPS